MKPQSLNRDDPLKKLNNLVKSFKCNVQRSVNLDSDEISKIKVLLSEAIMTNQSGVQTELKKFGNDVVAMECKRKREFGDENEMPPNKRMK
ncbi:hypothetical protein CHUAL_006203 [Chamberlinius hualienensis]